MNRTGRHIELVGDPPFRPTGTRKARYFPIQHRRRQTQRRRFHLARYSSTHDFPFFTRVGYVADSWQLR